MRTPTGWRYLPLAWWIGGLATVAVLTILGWAATAQGWANIASTAERQADLVEPLRRVACLGRLEPASRVIRLAAAQGSDSQRVSRLHVREGDWVEAGAIVAELDMHPVRQAAVQEAEARVAVAAARLQQVKAGARAGDIAARQAAVNRLRRVFQNADNEYQRSLRLFTQRAIAEAERDLKATQRESAARELQQAEAELASVSEVRAVDVAHAEAELKHARAVLASTRAHLELTRVRAPFRGRILKIHAWPGEKVLDRGVLELADTDRMTVVAEVYETDISRVRLCQPAEIRIPALDTQLEGKVAEIGLLIGKKDVLNNDPVADTDARVVEVRIHLSPEASARVANLTHLRVDVVIGSDGPAS